MAKDEAREDPIAAEAERARQGSDRSLLPASDGLGPGAGETPSAEVHGAAEGENVSEQSTRTPSLRGTPTNPERPDFRSSQLDGAPPEDEGGDQPAG